MIRYTFISKNSSKAPRGFTLLIAIIFTAVILSVSLSLLDVSYKEVVLASTARQSEYAFYNADAALECALELDQQYDTFDYNSEAVGTVASPIMCEGQQITNITATAAVSGSRTTTFSIPCANGAGSQGSVTVVKKNSGTPANYFYANGFNDCNTSDPQRVERGIDSHY